MNINQKLKIKLLRERKKYPNNSIKGGRVSSSAISINNHKLNDNLSFRNLCLEVSEIVSSFGISVKPYSDSRLPYFSTLSDDKKKYAIASLSQYLKICSAFKAYDKQADPKTLIWFAIRQFGFRPTSDLFSYIDSEHVIEIHDLGGVQIFRNFEFYRYCSYSMEELYTLPWTDLFSHEPYSHQKLIEKAIYLLSGDVKNVIKFDLPTHRIQEKMSTSKLCLDADVLYGAPLFASDNRPTATIVLERGRLIEATADMELN